MKKSIDIRKNRRNVLVNSLSNNPNIFTIERGVVVLTRTDHERNYKVDEYVGTTHYACAEVLD